MKPIKVVKSLLGPFRPVREKAELCFKSLVDISYLGLRITAINFEFQLPVLTII